MHAQMVNGRDGSPAPVTNVVVANLPSQNTTLSPPFTKELLGLYAGGSNPQESLIPILPATYRQNYRVHPITPKNISAFLDAEFCLTRLNKIHNYLWLCGLPSSPRSLHYQQLKGRQIVISEQLDLHLIWSSNPNRIFVKPLPRYLLSPQFWRSHICVSRDVYQTALGFILSYIHLIERESDFNIATEHNLLPAEISWPAWLEFMKEVLAATADVTHSSAPSKMHVHTSQAELKRSDSGRVSVGVNPRFVYGELRLGRLNWITRLILGNPRGYLSGCTTYGAFVRDNINSLITVSILPSTHPISAPSRSTRTLQVSS